MDSTVLFDLSCGVYVVSAMDGERPTGCVVNSVMQITDEPITLALSVNRKHLTHECIQKTGRFGISVLGENSDRRLIGRFGFQSGRDVDKFQNVDAEVVSGIPVLTDACSDIVCHVVDQMETPTHTIFLGKVEAAEKQKQEDAPMTYVYYRRKLKKGS